MTSSPLKTIWFSPRVTIRRILERKSLASVIILASLTGINGALDEASNRMLGESFPLWTTLLGSLIVGPLIALIAILVFSFVIKWSGKLIGGEGNIQRIATAVAWSSLPALVGLVFWIPQLLILGSENFQVEMPTLEANPSLLMVYIALDRLSFVFSFWGIVMLCFMLAEAQKFVSAWRGLANLALAAALILGVTFLLGFIGLSF